MNKVVLLLLFFVYTSHLRATGVALSLEEAIKIAKERIKEDKLPEDHVVVTFVDLPQVQHRFYSIDFDPRIPDPASKESNVFIGYIVEMDGTIKRSTIEVKKVPAKLSVSLESRIKVSPSTFLNTPYQLGISTGRQGARAPF